MNNEKECAVYLQTQKAYHRAMEEMRKKWRSYGKAAGRITLKYTSEEERRAVSGITGKRYLGDTICFSLQNLNVVCRKPDLHRLICRNFWNVIFMRK